MSGRGSPENDGNPNANPKNPLTTTTQRFEAVIVKRKLVVASLLRTVSRILLCAIPFFPGSYSSTLLRI